MNRYWPEEQIVDKFFAALQKQDYEDGIRHLDARSAMEAASGETFADIP